MKTYFLFYILAFTYLLTSCASSTYVSYLKDNTEVIKKEDSLHFTSLGEDFYKNKLFFVGEVHEVGTSPRIDFAMFTQLHEKIKVDVYLAEMDLAQGYYLQKYLEGSDALELQEILKKWEVYIGSISSQYRDKWKKMRSYYSQLPVSSKFEIVAVDKIADFDLVRMLLKEKLPHQNHQEIPNNDQELILWSENRLGHIIEANSSLLEPETVTLLKNIQFNISNHTKIRYRDQFMYENFKRYYTQNQWENDNIYGGFGFAHTLQAYDYTIAGKIKNDKTLPYADKMVSMNALYVDSRLTVESNHLPKFMQDKGQKFTRFKYSQDNRLFMYVKGIADYKKVTQPNTISLIKLDGEDSPYLTSTRGTKVKKIITIWDGYDIIEGTSTTDYAQYVFFIRNADWIQPDVK